MRQLIPVSSLLPRCKKLHKKAHCNDLMLLSFDVPHRSTIQAIAEGQDNSSPMSRGGGYGIAGHVNSYDCRVRIDNWVSGWPVPQQEERQEGGRDWQSSSKPLHVVFAAGGR